MAVYYELLASSDAIAEDTARAYLDVQRYRESLALAKDNYATHADVHQKIESRVKAGVGRRVDLEQASGRLALAESNWLTEASNLHDVTARYQRLTGEMPAEYLPPSPVVDKFLPTRTSLLTDAISHNPTFLGAVSTIRSYRADADLRRSALSPKLELRASQSIENNRSGVTGSYRDSAIQLVLNYNLYNGGADSERVNQYVAKLNAAYDLRDKACRDVRQTAQIAYNDVGRLTQQLIFLAQHELSTAKAREAYRQQFDIGQRSLLDLLDTENELYQARRALTNAEHDLRLAKFRVLSTSVTLLGALELRILADSAPTESEGHAEDDGLMRCSTELPTIVTLDKPAPPKMDPAPAVAIAPAPVQRAPDNCQKLTATVDDWVDAWNRKDSSAYLRAYSDSFVPALGMSRPAWEAFRKKRLDKQGDLTAKLKDIRPTRCDNNTAEVTFTQDYGSVDYNDSVQKTLSFEFVNGAWRITRETVTQGRTF
ncbi:TolC family protein [Rhodoferax sp. PAMC 29310]|uniref:TolC family protein n=1 Tax=Rhodoferax sp. PAMC 29310 TaxID=2822760 RepID=UPI001F0AB791|nr:TolC family protein [Rhodoferax sp. PAMC 29310]